MPLIIFPVIFKKFCLTALFLSNHPKAHGITVHCMQQSQSLPFFYAFNSKTSLAWLGCLMS